jgi:hypothetical protein
MKEQGVARAIRFLAPALILGYALLSVLERRSLHADGAWAFLQGLIHQGYWVGDPTRILANLLAQTPFAVGAMVGVDNRITLEYLHGFGYVIIPALAWVVALLIVTGTRIYSLLLLGYCVTTLTSGFLAVGDFNFLFAFSALCFAAIMRHWRTRGIAFAWIALIVGCVVAVSHGLTALLAPLLIAAIVLPWRRLGSPSSGRVPLLATAVVLGLGTCLGIYAVARPYSPGNVVRAMDLAGPLIDNRQLQLTVLWLILLPLSVLARFRWLRGLTLSVVGLSLLAFVLVDSLWATPLQQYQARTWSAILFFLLLLVALLVDPTTGRMPTVGAGEKGANEVRRRDARMECLTAVVFVGLLIPSVIQTVQFGAYLRAVDAFVNAASGQVPNADFVAAVPLAKRYGWSWAFPSISLVVRRVDSDAIVLNLPNVDYIAPFEAGRPPGIPARFAIR